MRIVLQRVSEASVSVAGERLAGIEQGLVALVGVDRTDDLEIAGKLAAKTASLRLFPGENDGVARPFDRSIGHLGGAVLCVSQFTLLGDLRRGNRPSWSRAAPGADAEPLVAAFAARLREAGIVVEEGVFGADMQVALVNDGPVTVVLDSEDLARSRRFG